MNKLIAYILIVLCCACSDIDLTVPNEVKEVTSYTTDGTVCRYSLYDKKGNGYGTIDGPCG